MKTLRTYLGVVCILVITVCAILIAQRLVRRARVDLTQNKLYTLSEGTRNILAKLGQPLTLKLYYARTAALKGPEDIRFYNNYYLYVRDLLEEYVRLSNGNLRLEIIDPRRFTDEEEDAIRHGVKRFPLSEQETFFFGLVVKTQVGKEEVIPFFEPGRQEFVEYDISKAIVNVTQRTRKKVGILSSLPVMGDDMSPYMVQMMRMQGRQPQEKWTIVSHIEKNYEPVRVANDVEEIDADMDYLMVVHPKDVPEKTLFAIDQFVMRGGKLMVFLDPHCLSDRPPQDPQQPWMAMQHKSSSQLNDLLKNWGVEMDPEQIAVDRNLAITAPIRQNANPQPVPVFLELTEANVNKDEVMVADLHTLRMVFAGALNKVSGVETTVEPLLMTSKVGNVWKPTSPFEIQMLNPPEILRKVDDGVEPVMLACRITGKLKTNFPDGKPGEKKDEEKKGEPLDAEGKAENAEKKEGEASPAEPSADAEAKPDADKAGASEVKVETPKPPEKTWLKEASPDAVVLVFSDVDMISNLVAYQETFFGTAQSGDNASLVFNALDYLSGSGDLISIRSRGQFSRPFTVVDRIEAEAEKATAKQVEEVNRKIQEYREKLRNLGSGEEGKDARLIQSKALAERENIQAQIRNYEKELRRLNAGKRQKIEALKAAIQTHNMVWAPAFVLLIAIVLAIVRAIRARRYAARRIEE